MASDERESRRKAAVDLLALAAELGNVSEACRRTGVDRSAYYRSLKAVQGGEAEGVIHRVQRRRSEASREVERRILGLCLEYPEWGCDRLAHYLTLTGNPVSSPTAQKILMRHGLGRMAQRLDEARRRGKTGGGTA